MHPIARACLIPILQCPAVMEAECARICNRVDRLGRLKLGVQAPSPEANEWAIGRFPKARPARTTAHSAGFVKAALLARTAITGIRVSDPPGAEAAAGAAVRRLAVVAAVGRVAAAVAVVAAGIARSE